MTAVGDAPAPSERERKKRDRGGTLTPEGAARVGAYDALAREDHAMPARGKIPRGPDTSE